MRITRRSLLAGSGAVFLSGLLPSSIGAARAAAEAGGEWLTLGARPSQALFFGDEGPTTAIWGYEGIAPGPVIRVKQGTTANIRLSNLLTQPTTVHWHGIRIANEMDGVPDLTQPAVAPGESFDYSFLAPDAGTYWYHSHNQSWEQVARGLHGILIVEEEESPQVDQDLLLVLDDWRLDDRGAIETASFGQMMDISHGGRTGNVITINGQATSANIGVRTGERIRLRLCNVANARIFSIRLGGHRPHVVALDGQPVTPFEPTQRGVTLAPGQRADLMFDASHDPGTKHLVAIDAGNGEIVAGYISYDSLEIVRTNPLDAPIRLAANDLPTAFSSVGATEVELLMEGGAMGGMVGATYAGQQMGINELVNQGMVWAFNGVVGRTDKPLFSARLGERIVLNIVNRTAWPHAMHWHGHHGHILDSGRAERGGVWRDTVLSAPDESLKVGFIADNPGRWLLHCHMLEHQAGGMSTWFEVRT